MRGSSGELKSRSFSPTQQKVLVNNGEHMSSFHESGFAFGLSFGWTFDTAKQRALPSVSLFHCETEDRWFEYKRSGQSLQGQKGDIPRIGMMAIGSERRAPAGEQPTAGPELPQEARYEVERKERNLKYII